MSASTALIVDDEALLRAGLARQLAAAWPQLRVVAEAENSEQALAAFAEHRPQIVFLDIQMPGQSGLQIAEQLSGQCHIVFVSAHENYALEAFQQEAVDYLLKPVSEARLGVCVQRLQARLSQAPADIGKLLSMLQPPVSNNYLQWLKVSQRDEIRILALNEIDYLQAEDKYVNVYSQRQCWLLRASLKSLESQLDPQQFLRVHRSIIVRIAAIDKIKRSLTGGGWLSLKSIREPLPVSRAALSKLLDTK